MGNKLFGIIIGILVIGVVGILLVAGGGEEAASDLSREAVLTIDDTDHYQGADPQQAEVVIIEYFDFACPSCARVYPVVEELIAQYNSEPVTFVTRNFSFLGGNSAVAHRAAEAAGLQDNYYEMYGLLFQQQQLWSNSSNPTQVFEGYAQQLGLDVEQFTADLNSAAVGDLITSDKAQADVVEVNATPTFFINGEKIETTPQTLEEFQILIEAALAG